MKNTKINLLLMAALIAVQTTVHAKDKVNDKPEQKQPRTWRQAAYDNRLYILGGSAAVGLGALGYVFGEDIKDWFSKQSPETQQAAVDVLEKSIDKDLQAIEEKQEAVAEKIDAKKHSTAQQKEIVKEEKEIAQVQQQVAQKQSWLQYMGFNLLGIYSPEAIEARAQYAAEVDAEHAARDAEYAAEHGDDYRSSDDVRSDRERAEHIKDQKHAGDRLKSRNEFMKKMHNSSNEDFKQYHKNIHLRELDELQKERYEGPAKGHVSKVLSGDFSEVKSGVSRANDSIKETANNVAESAKNAYNNVAESTKNAYKDAVDYFSQKPAATDDLVPNSELSVANSSDGGQY